MRRSVAQLLNKAVTVKCTDGTYTGTLDLSDDNGVWLALDPASTPKGAPPSIHIRAFFPFAQMSWLAVSDD
jgi:hypothetical protein